MSFEVDPARRIINTDIPTLGNYYTGENPDVNTYPVSVRLVKDGRLDPTRRYAPFDLPGMARVLAVARLPQGCGKYANGLIMVYSASTSGYTCPANGKVGNIWQPGDDTNPGYLDTQPDSTVYQMPLGQYEVRAAVHLYSPDVSSYSSGWVTLGTTFGRGGWRYDQEYTPEVNGYAADTVATFDDTYEVYGLANTTFNDSYLYQHTNLRGTYWPMTVNLAAQRLGKYVVACLPHNYPGMPEGVQWDDSVPNMWLIDCETLTAKPMQVMDGAYFDGSGLESEVFTNYSLFLDDGVDPYLYLLSGGSGGVSEMRVRVSEITLPAQKSTFPLTYGTCIASGDLALIQSYALEGPGVKNVNPHSPGEVTTVYVNPWRNGDYVAPELWAFVRTNSGTGPGGIQVSARLHDARLRDAVQPTLTSVTATATYDIYAFQWQPGEFRRDNNRVSMSLSDREPLVSIQDDDAYVSGATQYPAANPTGMARERLVFDAAHKVATINVPHVEVPYDGQVSKQMIFGVYRNPRRRGHLILAIQTFGDVLDSRTGQINPAFYQNRHSKFSAAGSTTQFWTAHSYDDGKTWTSPGITAQPPLAHRPDSGDASHKIDGHLIVPWDDGYYFLSGRPTTRTTDVLLDGQVVVGVTEYIGVTNADGSHVPFWTSPPVYGTRHSLYFPEGFIDDSSSSLVASPDGVIFKRMQP